MSDLSPHSQPEVASAEVAPESPARACPSCGAGLNADQDWCLECGTAQPGRVGGRPGWRAALTVFGLTTVLAGGAAAAAVAALSTESEKQVVAQAPAPAPAAGTPAPTQPGGTVVDVPTDTAPTTPQTTPKIPAPESDPADLPDATDTPDFDSAPATPVTPVTPATPATPSTPSTGGGTTDSGGGTETTETTETEPERVPVDLPKSASGTYDPYTRTADAGAKASEPSDAFDGDTKTAWEAPVGADGKVQMGLVVSLKEVKALTDLELRADTPGFTVEVYATRATELPADVTDERWEHVTDARDAGVSETLKLDGKYRHVLLWFTVQPADTKVRIPEIKLFDK